MTSILLGAGQLSPEAPLAPAPVEPPPAGPPADGRRPLHTRRALLGAAAVVSPLLLAGAFALDPAGLPREDPAVFLGAIAASPDAYVAGTVLQLGAMVTSLAGAAVLALLFRHLAPRLSALTAVLLTLGAAGGIGFVGLKLAAIGLTADGALRPGAVDVWSSVQSGPAFTVLVGPLLCAALGLIATTVLLVRGRRLVGWWPAPVNLVGAVLGSGEFPDVLTVAGPVVQAVATVALVRAFLRSTDAA